MAKKKEGEIYLSLQNVSKGHYERSPLFATVIWLLIKKDIFCMVILVAVTKTQKKVVILVGLTKILSFWNSYLQSHAKSGERLYYPFQFTDVLFCSIVF